MEKRALPIESDLLFDDVAGSDPLEAELLDDGDLLEDDELLDGARAELAADGAAAEALDAEAIRAELEARMADARGEMGARIAELEGELEALREERSEWTRELDELEAELLQRATLVAETRAGAEQLREALSALDEERMALVSQVAHLQHDRERIQDDLAAQIAQLAGELGSRDQEIHRLQRQLEQSHELERSSGPVIARLEGELAELRALYDDALGAQAGAASEELAALRAEVEELRAAAPAGEASDAAAAEIARLQAELDDLAGENEFLHSELDRYAAEAARRDRHE